MDFRSFCGLLLRLLVAFLTDRLTGWVRQHRLFCLSVLAGVLVFCLYQAAAPLLDRVLYKAVLQMVGAAIGYGLDYFIFPYARPHHYLVKDWRQCSDDFCDVTITHPVAEGYRWLFAIACSRRAVFVLAGIYGITQGL